MNNSKLVKKLLLELKPEEISFIGQFRYDVIFKVYFEDTSPKKIAEEMNVPFEAVDEAIGYGYWFLKHIIWYNY